MKFKRILIVSILLTILTMGFVSASDTNDALDDNSLGLVEHDDGLDVLSVENNEENLDESKLEASAGSFTNLANKIDKANNQLILDRNYSFTDDDGWEYEEGIYIDKTITIDGNGYTINGNGQASAFRISAPNVVLKNINFVNCSSWRGGAVYLDYDADECTLSDCSFIDCSSSSWGGGAVCWNAANGVLSGCSFINCSASNGGAVYLDYDVEECTLSDCSFKGCTADEYGGGIYVFGERMNCSVINSVFQGNSAQSGADFYSEGSLNLVNVTVDKMSTAVISDTLSMAYGSSAKLIITLKNINNNNVVANSPISIMFNNKEYAKTTDSKGQASLDMPTNLAVGDYEATISYKGNSKYYPASTTAYIYIYEMDTQISAVHDDENKEFVATLTTIEGKAIGGVNVVANLNGKNSTLKTDSKGQVKLSAADLKSGRNTAKFTYKGSSGKYQQSSKSINVYVNDDVSARTFIDLMSEIENADGQLKLTRNYTYDAGCDSEDCPYGIHIEKTIEIDGNGYTINGNGQMKAFRIIASNVVLRNINFLDCSFYGNGGAIYWGGEAMGANGFLSNCTFVNSSSEGSGGAVYWNAPNGVISDCVFENCYAEVSGGAILWTGYHKNATVTGCSFVNCHSDRVGGAVSGPGDEGTLTNCHFENCYSETGGAVYLNENSLSDCSFVNCHSDSVGGAIYWRHYYSGYYVSGSSFLDCSADEDGGAIYSDDGDNAIISDCSFIRCSADGNGGAVYWTDSNESVVKSSFTNCHASKNGGGIYFDGENCSLIGSTFKDNTASKGSDWYGVYPVNVANKTSVGTVISAPSISTSYSVSKNLIVTLKDVGGNPLAGEQISIVLNNVRYTAKTNSKGKASLAIPTNLSPKTYVATISYAGNEIYESSSTTANVVVNKASPVLTVDDVVAFQNTSSAVVVATLKDAYGNVVSDVKVKIVVGSLSKIARTDANGQVSMDISSLGPGEYNIAARSGVTDIYNEAKTNAHAVIYANKLDTSLTIPDVVAVYNTSGAAIVATLKDMAGNLVSGVKVKIVVGTLSEIARTDGNGQVSMDISSLGPGEYKISARSGVTDIYNEAKTTAKATIIDKFNATLTIPDVVAVYNTTGAAVVATLKDMAGNLVSGVKVKIVVGTLSEIARTDGNGQVSMDISSLAPGEYKVSARSGVTDIYNEAKATAKAIIVDKFNTTLSIPDVEFGYGAPGVVVATLKDMVGNVVSGVKVKIVVGDLSKIARTDANGQVTMDISSLGVGEYKISARSGITDIYNEAKATATANVTKITPSLVIPNAVAVYNTEGNVVATLKDAAGNAISDLKVKIVVGTLSKIARTDANGQVSMDISSLAPGEYRISARTAVTDIYNEAKTTATAIVSEDKIDTTLTIPDVEIQQGNGVAVATLKDAYGNIISGVKVKIVVGSLSKIARTDANGQVSLDISSLAPGEYKVSARSAITDIYNEAKASAKATIYAS